MYEDKILKALGVESRESYVDNKAGYLVDNIEKLIDEIVEDVHKEYLYS
jgi:hypothetical protein